MEKVPVKKVSILLWLVVASIFFAVQFAHAQSISFAQTNPGNNNFLIDTQDFANVETSAYQDALFSPSTSNNGYLYVAWGGPVNINSFGQITSDSDFTDTTLVSNLSNDGGAQFADIYNNGTIDVVVLQQNSSAPDFYVFQYLGNRKFGQQQLLFSGTYPSNWYGYTLQAVVDLEGNGYPDIICRGLYYVGTTLEYETIIYWNNDGTFSASDSTIIPNAYYEGAADWTGNGLKDLIMFSSQSSSSGNGNPIEIYMQTSKGACPSSPTYTFSGINGYGYAGFTGYGGTPTDAPIVIGNFTGKYPSFLAVQFNPVSSGTAANEIVLFSNNWIQNGSGFTLLPVWTDNNTPQEGISLMGSSADINGDGNPNFVIDRGYEPYNYSTLEVWYTAPLDNAITFETQIITSGDNSAQSYGYVGNLTNSGLADIENDGYVYYAYKDTPIPTPVFPTGGGGGGGGGAVDPVLIIPILALVYVKRKYRR